MTNVIKCILVAVVLVFAPASAEAQTAKKPNPAYDAELAKKLGGSEGGMRQYVFVLLKTGPTPVPEGEERKAMFAGHMANLNRLADEGKLVMAGPLDKVDGWRGLFIFAETDIEAVKKMVAS